jgi:multicomponent Na+:H+ antiporter subunit F
LSGFYVAVSAFLLATVLAGLVRVVLGPTPADRMLAAQLFGTTGVAVLLLLAQALTAPPLRDVALVLALLSVLAVIAFVLRAWERGDG